MMLLTAVFDNAIIGFGLVDYDESLISGPRIGFAPIEDFAYTVAALLIIPALWHLMAAYPRKTGQ
jgi:lycopene cyclase domain-containing protein